MARVLYGVSPIGLGHATRTIAIVEKLSEQGVDVKVFSGGDAATFLGACGYPTEDVVSDAAPAVVDGVMKRAALWYIRSWAALKSTAPKTGRIFDDYKPDLVVCDEEFSGLGIAASRGCKRALVSDELELGFARGRFARSIEKRVDGWYKRLQEDVDLLVIPEFGTDSGNRRYVGPVVREVTKSATEARVCYNLPSTGRMVLLSLSGSRMGAFLIDVVVSAMAERWITDSFLVVSGNRGPRVTGEGIYDLGVVLDNQNLVAAADLVVSTAGKSTQDEAASEGTPFIGLPIRHHAEQERNAASLGYSAEDSLRIRELITEKIGRRSTPLKFQGARAARDALLSSL